MTISAVGAFAQSMAGGLGAGPRPVDPALGVTFRFKVTVGDLDLGEWTSCTGLKVDFKPVELKSGGNYLGPRWLAGEATYSRVVLKRAAVKSLSSELQSWLRTWAINWLNGDEDPELGADCAVTLFDSSGGEVMTWTLERARPAAWSGPDLDATTSKVALETLELVHSGFTVTVPGETAAPGAGQGAAGNTRCTLAQAGGPSVEFTFPPAQVQVQRRQESASSEPGHTRNVRGSQPERNQTLVVDADTATPNVTTYSLNDLVLWGPQTRSHVEALLVWATKNKVTGTDVPQAKLTFTWGTGFNGIPVLLKTVTATYTRFAADGVPIRAKVTLRLEQCGEAPASAAGPGRPAVAKGAMNPTSGGLPGRSAHRLLETETLPGLARRTYGDATGWRAIAEANGVDDPLRLRPGTVLLLPAPIEVEPRRGSGGRR